MEKDHKFIYSILIGCVALSVFTFAKQFESRPFKSSVFTRALNTAYQPSLGQPTLVVFSPTITANLTLTTGQTGTIDFQTSPDNVTYTSQSTVVNGSTGTLVIGLNTNNAQGSNLIATVPPGYWFKFVSSGTATNSGTKTQESQF